jgi:hypothetical protein
LQIEANPRASRVGGAGLLFPATIVPLVIVLLASLLVVVVVVVVVALLLRRQGLLRLLNVEEV